MSTDALIAAQMQQALARQDEILRALSPAAPGIAGVRQQAADARSWWNEGGPAMAEVRDALVPGPHRDIPVTLYVPSQQVALRPAYVYLHGGGFRIGSPRASDRQLRELAAAWGGIVVSADYAHMPEAIFPVAVEETVAVYQWLAGHGDGWGIDGTCLAGGGSSAGANVALGAAIAAGGTASGLLKACACVVGVFDDALGTDSMLRFGDLVPGRDSARAMFADYAPQPQQRSDPRFNLLLAEPALFPPLFLAAAQCDAFHDSSQRLASHVARAGAQPELKTYAGMTHLFFGYSRMVDAAQECVADMARFLSRHLPVAQ